MDLSTRLKTYLDRHRLRAIEKIGRGFAAETHLVRDARGKRSVIKIERDDSPRRDFTYKESEYLRAANTVRVGPKLLDADYDLRCVRMEFIDGVPFGKWLLDENKPPTKTKLRKCVRNPST
jgi:predicted Ser/Thr protein kinase